MTEKAVGLLLLSASLVLGCDDLTGCAVNEYCSDQVLCNSCVDICNSSNHNYDHVTCYSKCLKYLHSLYVIKSDLYDYLKSWYVSKAEYNDTLSKVSNNQVSKLQNYLAVSLICSGLVITLLIIAFLVAWLRYQQFKNGRNKILKKKLDSIKVVCVNDTVDNGKKLKLEMPPVIADREQSPPSAVTAMTPLSTRHPSEDATLEYAYDNPTLTHSPEFGKNHLPSSPSSTPQTNRIETTF